jgi:hypothetical protein
MKSKIQVGDRVEARKPVIFRGTVLNLREIPIQEWPYFRAEAYVHFNESPDIQHVDVTDWYPVKELELV